MPKRHKLLRRRTRELRKNNHNASSASAKLKTEFAGRVRMRSIRRAMDLVFGRGTFQG